MWQVRLLRAFSRWVDDVIERWCRSLEAPPRTVSYRSRDGRSRYVFSIERRWVGAYVVYITERPRSAYLHTLVNWRGREYICWSRPLFSEDDAVKVAALWAKLNQTYIKTGRGF